MFNKSLNDLLYLNANLMNLTAECLAGSSSQWAYRFRNLSSLVVAVA